LLLVSARVVSADTASVTAMRGGSGALERKARPRPIAIKSGNPNTQNT
jgi:hypothetical protein